MSYPIIKVSAYKSHYSAAKQTFVPGAKPYDTDVYQELLRIRDGYYKDIIDSLRAIQDPAEYKKKKAEILPSVSFSCVTKDWRSAAAIVNHTGLLNIDIDGKDNPHLKTQSDFENLRDLLAAQPHVLAAWLSASGLGVTFLIRIDPSQHKEAFMSIKQEMLQAGVTIDAGLHDVPRIRFASFDPEIRLKEDFDAIPVYKPNKASLEAANAEKKHRAKSVVNTANVATGDMDKEEIFKECITVPEKNHSFAEGEKHKYLRDLAAKCNSIGMSQDFCEKMVVQYYAAKTDISTDELLKPVRNVYKAYAGQHGTKPKFDDKLKPMYGEIHFFNRSGVAVSKEAFDKMARKYEQDIERVIAIAKKIYSDHADEFGIDNKSEIEQVEWYLNKKYELMRNLVTQQREYRLRGTQDDYKSLSADEIWRELSKKGYKFDLNKVKSLLRTSFVQDYDPFRRYFEGLPEWDRTTDYIEKLASYIETDDDEFFCEQLKKALVRSIACAVDHIENRIVFTLVQPTQNAGKSSWIRFINPWGTKKYYTESPLRDGKDTEFKFAENFMYNMEELSSLSNIDVNKLKAIISKNSIKERKPFATDEEMHPRRCNFFASTNKPEFLTDSSNTRWLCFNVLRIKSHDYSNYVTGVKELSIDDVWAQAWFLYQNGFSYQLTQEETQKQDEANHQYEVISSERDLVLKLTRPAEEKKNEHFHSPTDILAHLMTRTDGRIRINLPTLIKTLDQLEYPKGEKLVSKRKIKGYYVRLLSDIDTVSYDDIDFGSVEPEEEEDDLPF